MLYFRYGWKVDFMRSEIYQEIDELVRNFSLSKEEIDQMYLEEGITDKSL